MTAQDYWALSPVIAMAGLALVLLSADALLAERMFGGRRYGSKRALSWIAVIGLAVPAFLALNLWFEWFGESTSEAVRLRYVHCRPIRAVLPVPDHRRDGRSDIGVSAVLATVQGFPWRVFHVAVDGGSRDDAACRRERVDNDLRGA